MCAVIRLMGKHVAAACGEPTGPSDVKVVHVALVFLPGTGIYIPVRVL